MKNLFKLTTAALALVAFASCSNDELLGTKGTSEAKNFASVLEYEIEAPEGIVGTRAARNANGGGFVFQKDDQLRVYDEDLGKFDPYVFDTKFGRENAKSNLKKDPAYALFPAEDVRKGYCDADGNHIAEVKIGTRMNAGDMYKQFNKIEYSTEAGSEAKVGETVVYQCDVPMWGEVVKVDDKTVKTKTNLSPLSGVLMLTLNNTMGNITWIKLHSDAGYLGGTFYANLDDAEPAFYINDTNEYLDLTKDLYIDLRKVPSDKAVLYIPVVAGINDLKIYRTAKETDIPTAQDATHNPTGTVVGDWTMISNESGYTFKRNGWHKVGYSYTLSAGTPEQISITLAQLSSQTDDLSLNMVKALDLTQTQTQKWKGAAAVGDDNTIYMPNMAADVVTLNIANDVTVGTKKTLNVVDADDADPFTGTLVIKATNLTKQVLFTNITLPKAKVVLLGNFSTTGNESVFTTIVADELELGDGSTTTNVGYATSNVNLAGVNTAIDILAGATYTGTINAQTALTNFAPITIKGQVAGDINTKGDVNVELATAAPAITGTLKFFRGGTTVTIKQGYVGTITNDFTALGEANDKTIKVDLDDAKGITAIKEVTPAGAAITLTESTLSGLAIPPTIDGYITTTAGVSKIYTASQLERIHTLDATTASSGLTFGNDLNMAKAAWTAPFGNATAAAFTIASTVADEVRTIKNLSYNKYARTVTGVGFVGNATALTVSNFALDKVSFNRAYVDDRSTAANTFEVLAIGAIAGKASGATSLTNVSVNISGNFGYKEYSIVNTGDNKGDVNVTATAQGIGGLIGMTAGAALNAVSVKGNLIEGYTSLGGFIGCAGGAVTIDKYSKSAIKAFKINYSDPAAANIEMNLARVGGAIGYQGLATGNVTIAAGATTNDVAVTLPAGGADKLYVKVSAGTGNKLYSFGLNQQWVGFCGTENAPAAYTGTVTIGTTNYVSPTFNTAGALDNLAPNQPLYTWTAKAN